MIFKGAWFYFDQERLISLFVPDQEIGCVAQMTAPDLVKGDFCPGMVINGNRRPKKMVFVHDRNGVLQFGE